MNNLAGYLHVLQSISAVNETGSYRKLAVFR